MTRACLMEVICALALGAFAGWTARGEPAGYAVETPRASVTYGDGSVLAERAPQAKPSLPAPARPAGSRVTRTEEVTIQPGKPIPRPLSHPAGNSTLPRVNSTLPRVDCPTAEDFTCPPINVRLDVLEMPDGTTRVTGRTDTGDFLAFRDIPMGKTKVAMRNHLVAVLEPQEDLHSLTFLRDIGRITLGAGLTHDAGQLLPTVAAGWSW